ncbi:DUF4265 domain-containing protein [Massilia scottii]|uniref:DUF4265 domain-containing protein n=1 Tax=Massilia scottii TaxID=3057166 RepID=UPI002796BA2F|nr:MULTISPECIES: DUF4265 domain-containing protein [unclassified Massilia]MDQ1817279.1 DUF4265 domain-containing protein [Massilia sp. CCM 9210]MDQ1835340.1 DUF4265 domain-containing protein [Massilia sp. CCM 9029]
MINDKSADSKSAGMVKVFFDLEQVDGFPPVSVESLWAEKNDNGLFKIANIPFYVMGIALGDEISARLELNGELKFDSLVNSHGHSTIRMVFFELDSRDELIRKIEALGCAWEGSHEPSLIAIDVPPSADLSQILSFLSEGFSQDLFDYQEGAIRE